MPAAERDVPVDSYLLYLQARQNNDAKNAVEFLKRAIDADPDNKNLRSEMFALLTVEGRVDDAFPYAVGELKTSPDSLLASLVVVGTLPPPSVKLTLFPPRGTTPFCTPCWKCGRRRGWATAKKR